MLGKIFKYGFFIRLYLLFKDRFSNWLWYFFLILIIFYAHSEIVEYSSAIEDKSLVKWSFIIKNFSLIVIIGMFIFKETNIFKTKTSEAEIIKDTDQTKIKKVLNHSEEVEISSIEGDGFDHVRKKTKLNTHAEKLLNK